MTLFKTKYFILVQCSTMGGRGIQNPERSWILLHGQYILKHFVLELIDTKNYLNVLTTREQSQIILSASQKGRLFHS